MYSSFPQFTLQFLFSILLINSNTKKPLKQAIHNQYHPMYKKKRRMKIEWCGEIGKSKMNENVRHQQKSEWSNVAGGGIVVNLLTHFSFHFFHFTSYFAVRLPTRFMIFQFFLTHFFFRFIQRFSIKKYWWNYGEGVFTSCMYDYSQSTTCRSRNNILHISWGNYLYFVQRYDGRVIMWVNTKRM